MTSSHLKSRHTHRTNSNNSTHETPQLIIENIASKSDLHYVQNTCRKMCRKLSASGGGSVPAAANDITFRSQADGKNNFSLCIIFNSNHGNILDALYDRFHKRKLKSSEELCCRSIILKDSNSTSSLDFAEDSLVEVKEQIPSLVDTDELISVSEDSKSSSVPSQSSTTPAQPADNATSEHHQKSIHLPSNQSNSDRKQNFTPSSPNTKRSFVSTSSAFTDRNTTKYDDSTSIDRSPSGRLSHHSKRKHIHSTSDSIALHKKVQTAHRIKIQHALSRYQQQTNTKAAHFHHLKQRKECISSLKHKLSELKQQLSQYEADTRGNRYSAIDRHRLKHALPIYAYKNDIQSTILRNQVCLITADTGAGKSTQIPQYIADLNLKCVCTQPRRISAKTVASRVSKEYRCSGKEVVLKERYAAPNQTHTGDIVFMTDAQLLDEVIRDAELSRYDVVVLDEAHERSLHTDLLLGALTKALRNSSRFKLVITSATIDAKIFQDFFEQHLYQVCPVLKIPGRTYPVDVIYRDQQYDDHSELIGTIVNTTETILYKETKNSQDRIVRPQNSAAPGHILIFMHGSKEVDQTVDALQISLRSQKDNILVLPLYSALPSEDQSRVFEDFPVPSFEDRQQGRPRLRRKIIVATNIAETSLTIDGLQYVIDTGLCKENRYDHSKGMSVLETRYISRASAQQRAGRAGRTGPGVCYRLYSESEFQTLDLQATPEIFRIHLSLAVLKIKQLGIHNLHSFPFLQKPDSQALTETEHELLSLEALTTIGEDTTLTPTGKVMAQLSIDPRLSKLIYSAFQKGVGKEAIITAALLLYGDRFFWRGRDNEERQKQIVRKSSKLLSAGDLATARSMYEKSIQDSPTHFQTWCSEHGLNSRVLKEVRQFIFAIQKTMMQITGSKNGAYLSRHYSVSTRTESTDKVIKQLVYSVLHQNLCVFNGDPSLGYLMLSNGKSSAVPHPSSSLFCLNYYPKFLLYYNLQKTSRNFMKLCIEVEDLEEFLESIPDESAANIRAKLRSRTIHERIRFTNNGSALIRKLLGKGRSNVLRIEEQLGVIINIRDGDIELWVESSRLAESRVKFEKLLARLRHSLENEVIEIPLCGSTRGVLGKGCCLSDILVSDEGISLSFFKVPASVLAETLRQSFEKFGHLVEFCLFGSRMSEQKQEDNITTHTGFVTYNNKESTEKALREWICPSTANSYAPATLLKRNQFVTHSGSNTIQVTWYLHSEYITQAYVHFLQQNHAQNAYRSTTSSNKYRKVFTCNSPKERAQESRTTYSIRVSNIREEMDPMELNAIFSKYGECFVVPIWSEQDIIVERGQIIHHLQNGIGESSTLLGTNDERFEQAVFETTNSQILKLLSPVSSQITRTHMRALRRKQRVSIKKFKAYYGFSHPEAALRAIELLNRKEVTLEFGDMNSSTLLLHADMDHDEEISISSDMYRAIKGTLEQKRNECERRYQVRITIKSHGSRTFIRIKPKENVNHVSKVRDALHHVLRGEIFEIPTDTDGMDQSVLLRNWNWTQTVAMVKQIEQRYRVHLWKHNNGYISIVGEDKARQRAKNALLKMAQKMSSSHRVVVPIPRGQYKAYVATLARLFHSRSERGNGYTRRIQPRNVDYDINLFRQQVILNGDSEAVCEVEEQLRSIEHKELHSAVESDASENHSGDRVCMICWSSSKETRFHQFSSCSHCMCVDCLLDQVNSAIKHLDFPIRCPHQDSLSSSPCGKELCIMDAKMVMPTSIFKKLCSAAFQHYIAQNSDTFGVCPGVDCPQVFRKNGRDTFFCDVCCLSYCTKCKKSVHEGFDCDTDMSHQELLSNDDIRPCPSCVAPIFKIEGCNHMQCSRCSTHFCWKCGAVFPVEIIYDHTERCQERNWWSKKKEKRYPLVQSTKE